MATSVWLVKPSECKAKTLRMAFAKFNKKIISKPGVAREREKPKYGRMFAGYYCERERQGLSGRSLEMLLEGILRSGFLFAHGKNKEDYEKVFINHLPLLRSILLKEARQAELHVPDYVLGIPLIVSADIFEEYGAVDQANEIRSWCDPL